jgi:hypothetical protein
MPIVLKSLDAFIGEDINASIQDLLRLPVFRFSLRFSGKKL